MAETRRSPRVTELSWGRVVIEGERVFKDVKLYPGGAEEWDWDESGTAHSPGIHVVDIEDLVRHGAETVVLSRGMHGRLRVSSEALAFLRDRGIPAHVLPTEEAVKKYNELQEAVPVGGLFHSTC